MDETKQERRARQLREATARYRARLKASRPPPPPRLTEEERKARAAARTEAWRIANPARYAQNVVKSRLQRKERWPEFLAGLRARYRANSGNTLKRQKIRRADPANVVKMAAYQREYAKLNAGKLNARTSARRAARIKATPSWCDMAAIVEIFRLARRLTEETGVRHEVDHIIPLQGKNVCGLHIPQNMQVITRSENRKKFTGIVGIGGTKENDRPGVSLPPAVCGVSRP